MASSSMSVSDPTVDDGAASIPVIYHSEPLVFEDSEDSDSLSDDESESLSQDSSESLSGDDVVEGPIEPALAVDSAAVSQIQATESPPSPAVIKDPMSPPILPSLPDLRRPADEELKDSKNNWSGHTKEHEILASCHSKWKSAYDGGERDPIILAPLKEHYEHQFRLWEHHCEDMKNLPQSHRVFLQTITEESEAVRAIARKQFWAKTMPWETILPYQLSQKQENLQLNRQKWITLLNQICDEEDEPDGLLREKKKKEAHEAFLKEQERKQNEAYKARLKEQEKERENIRQRAAEELASLRASIETYMRNIPQGDDDELDQWAQMRLFDQSFRPITVVDAQNEAKMRQRQRRHEKELEEQAIQKERTEKAAAAAEVEAQRQAQEIELQRQAEKEQVAIAAKEERRRMLEEQKQAAIAADEERRNNLERQRQAAIIAQQQNHQMLERQRQAPNNAERQSQGQPNSGVNRPDGVTDEELRIQQQQWLARHQQAQAQEQVHALKQRRLPQDDAAKKARKSEADRARRQRKEAASQAQRQSVQPTVNNPVPQLTAPGDSEAVTNKRKASEPANEEHEPKRVRPADETTNGPLKRMAVSGAEVAMKLVLNEALQFNTVFGLQLTQEKIDQQLTEANCVALSRSVVEGFENQSHLTKNYWAFKWGSIQALMYLVNNEVLNNGVPLGLQLQGGPVTDPSAVEAVHNLMHKTHTVSMKIFDRDEQKRAQRVGNPNAVATTPAATSGILGSVVRRPNLPPQPAVPQITPNGPPIGVMTLANSSKALPTFEEVNNASMAARNHQGPAQRSSVAVQAFQPPADAVSGVSAGNASNIKTPRHQANGMSPVPVDNARPGHTQQYMPMQSTPVTPPPRPNQRQKNRPIQPAPASPRARNPVSVGTPLQHFQAPAQQDNANSVDTPKRPLQPPQEQQPSTPANDTTAPGSPRSYFRFDTGEWWMIPSAPGQQRHHRVGGFHLGSKANMRVLHGFLNSCSKSKVPVPGNFTLCLWLSMEENWRLMQETSRLRPERIPEIPGMEL